MRLSANRFNPKQNNFSQSVYLSLQYGKQLSAEEWWRLTRVDLASEYGWTLEYIDSLRVEDVGDILAVSHARALKQEKGRPKAKGKPSK